MAKFKLDPFKVAMIVLVIVVFLTIFGRFINSVRCRIVELEKQINDDLKLLKLSKEREEELAQKVVMAYRITVSVIFFVFMSLIILTVLAGAAYNDALESYLGTTGVILALITTFFYNTWNPDVLLKMLREKIKARVYQRDGFNPALVELLQSRVNINQLELENLRMQNKTISLESKLNFDSET